MFSKLFRRSSGEETGVVGFDDLCRQLQAGECALIDVREPAEFRSGHIPGARNIPLSRFDPRDLPADRKIVLVCKSGMRSGAALRAARAAGLANVAQFPGGVAQWAQSGGALAS